MLAKWLKFKSVIERLPREGPPRSSAPGIVTDVTPAEFERLLRTRSDVVVVVQFYAEWCGACKAFKPVYEAVARRNPRRDVLLLSIDAANDAHTEALRPYDIREYPTVRVFRRGTCEPYDGKKQEDSLLAWVRKLPAATA